MPLALRVAGLVLAALLLGAVVVALAVGVGFYVAGVLGLVLLALLIWLGFKATSHPSH